MRELVDPYTVVGEFHTQLPNGKVRCEVCPRECELQEGQRAFCFVRQAKDGEIVLTSYGRSTGFCIDPIEKKPLNHFLPGTPVLSFGTAGCNLGCKFCQNWDISKAREIERLSSRAFPEDIAKAALKSGCRSVAFTYNDPVIFHEYAVDTAKACHEMGVKTVAVTAGYVTPKARKSFFANIDAANVDLKAFTEKFYHKLCYAHLDPVLDTLKYLLHETDTWFEVTTLLIPGQNDGYDEIAELCEWMLRELGPQIPLHFTAFHPDFKMLDLPRTPAETLVRARKQAKEMGIHHAYTGNVHDASGQGTYCGGCGELLIERNWYTLGTFNVVDGGCKFCGEDVPGRFESERGDWGPKRQALRIL